MRQLVKLLLLANVLKINLKAVIVNCFISIITFNYVLFLCPIKRVKKFVRKQKCSHLEGRELSLKPLSREQLNPPASEELMPADF